MTYFSAGKTFSLTSVLTRVAIRSLNIAEGPEAYNEGFYSIFMFQMGSGNEVEYFCHLACRLDYLNE